MSGGNYSKFVMPVIRVCFPFIALYAISMFVYPWFEGDWTHVQNVWERWQALNVGLLAFASSIIAFSIAQRENEKQRNRQFIAARAFLPQALSELCTYSSRCAELLQSHNPTEGRATSAKVPTPALPVDYREIFSQCIRYSDPIVADALAKILADLQVLHARLDSLSNPGATMSITFREGNWKVYVYSLGNLRARINKLFDFARGKAGFDSSLLSWEELKNAYFNLDFHHDLDELEDFSKRQLRRGD
ncbi:MAG TPA: hypothetical protein VNZ68_12440 [Rhodocyclaceae bacterium]|nr:hypothetical protein [Rhodocyclaceae bacterium]